MAYEQFRQHLAVLPRIERQLGRIADCMEAREADRTKGAAPEIPDSQFEAWTLWRLEVADAKTMLGFSEWLAWRKENT